MGVLYETSIAAFILLTLCIGGGAAWMTGRGAALTWRPLWVLAWFTLLLSLALRFLHFSLFEGTLLSVHYWLVDLVVLAVIALAGWRYTRTWQMVTQYSWLYEKSSPLSWRERA